MADKPLWATLADMGQATLHTARLTLVPLSDEHLDLEIELDTDPAVMRYLGNGHPRSRADIVERHAQRLVHPGHGLGNWAGAVAGEYVGWWILQPLDGRDQGPGQAQLGYRLLPRFWRQGLASEGARELIRHGFEDLGLSRIFAETMAVNAASRATMESAGLRYVRTFHLDWDEPIPGAEHGEVEYAITKERWLAQARSAERRRP